MHTLQLSDLRSGCELHRKLLESMQGIQGIANRVYTKDGTLLETNTLDLCFRGQRQAERELLSGMERSQSEDKTTYLLASQVSHHQTLNHLDPVAQLSYLQHYGKKTPLLDWTKRLQTAFYYGCGKYRGTQKERGRTAALFILALYGLNDQYRLTKYWGTKVGGIALSHNFDAVVRAVNPLTHSHFELFQHPDVKNATSRDGIILGNGISIEGLECIRGTHKNKPLKIQDVLSGPVAVMPAWSKGNKRVRVLESIFTIDGICQPNQPSHPHYAPYTLKLTLDSSCVEAILKELGTSQAWKKIDKLDQSRDDKAFNKLQNAFDHMMSGGFH